MPYTFNGLPSYIDEAADRIGLHDARQRHLARAQKQGSHTKTIGDALGQLPDMAHKAAGGYISARAPVDALETLLLSRAGLAAQLAGVDAAIVEVATALDLPLPDYLKEDSDAAEHLRSAGDHGVGDDLGPAQGGRARRRPR